MRTPQDEEDDVELSLHAQRGDARAWRAIIRRYTPMVHRLAARMLGPGADAEDACQEAFMKAHRSFDGFDVSRPLGPWLGRITYNVCLRRLANAKQRQGLATSALELAMLVEDAAPITPERDAAARETGLAVYAALDQLSAQDRAMVTMRYVDGLTDVEVGEAVGMNRNTVRTRLHRARQVLRGVLGPLLGGRSE